MFSLRRLERWADGLFGSGHSARLEADQGRVLPRPLRKPVRYFIRFAQGDIPPPRYSASALTALYLGAFTIYGALLGGHMPAVAQAVTARTGFAVDEISVSGNKEISEIDVLDQLELTGWTSLVGFDADAARERIGKLAWVENASVRKIYPDKIEVELNERKPFAVWQHDGKLSVIEPSGRIIASYPGTARTTLPVIVGLGAPEAGASFVATVAAHPDLARRVTSYVRVADRRWDLRLDSGVTVQLPEFGAAEALVRLEEMDRSDRLLSRAVTAVDMRLSDRVVVALNEDGKKLREQALKEQTLKRKPKTGART